MAILIREYQSSQIQEPGASLAPKVTLRTLCEHQEHYREQIRTTADCLVRLN